MISGPLSYRVFRETGPWLTKLVSVCRICIEDRGQFNSFKGSPVKLPDKGTNWSSLLVRTSNNNLFFGFDFKSWLTSLPHHELVDFFNIIIPITSLIL